jgi:Malate/L-lactate dehydrogenase
MKRFPPQELRDLAARLATAVGVPSDDAEILARALVDADLQGISTHGILRLNIYLQRIDKGLIDPRAVLTIERDGGCVLTLNAGNGLGQVQAVKALDLLLKMSWSLRTTEAPSGCLVSWRTPAIQMHLAASLPALLPPRPPTCPIGPATLPSTPSIRKRSTSCRSTYTTNSLIAGTAMHQNLANIASTPFGSIQPIVLYGNVTSTTSFSTKGPNGQIRVELQLLQPLPTSATAGTMSGFQWVNASGTYTATATHYR